MKFLKEKIRSDFKKKRLFLPKSDVELKSREISKSIFASGILDKYSTFMLYYPFKNEVSLLSLFYYLKISGKKVFFPKVEGKKIIPVKVDSLENFSKGFKGILEPVSQPDAEEKIEVIFVPGVAFDFFCYRLGYGGGFYDRFLQGGDFLKVGVCFDFQLVDRLPVESFDVPMDIVFTEKRKIRRNEWKL